MSPAVRRTLLLQEDRPAAPDASGLLAALGYFYPLTPGIETYFREHIFECFFRKGKLLLKAGAMCRHVYFIQKGVIRGFIREGRNDITTWITAESEMVTSIYSLDLQEPATENIQAIEDCELLAMSYDDLQELYTRHPEFNIVSRKLLQHYYRDAEKRAFIARLRNVEHKYRHFLDRHHLLANRIPLKYIASYLGTTLETLSRVRKKIARAGKRA